MVTTRHDASRSPQQPLPPTTTTEGPRQPTTKTTDKNLDISRKIHAPARYSSLSYRVFGVYNWTLCPISSHSACSSSSQLAAFSLSSNILGVLVIDLMRHSHVYFLGVLEFCTTGGVLAITPCSRRACYLISNVGVLDFSISTSTTAPAISLV